MLAAMSTTILVIKFVGRRTMEKHYITGCVLCDPTLDRIFMKDWGGMENSYSEFDVLVIASDPKLRCIAYGSVAREFEAVGLKKGDWVSLSGTPINDSTNKEGFRDYYLLIDKIYAVEPTESVLLSRRVDHMLISTV